MEAAEEFDEARFSCQGIEGGTKTSFEIEAVGETLLRAREQIRIEVVSLAEAEVNHGPYVRRHVLMRASCSQFIKQHAGVGGLAGDR